MSPFQLVVDRVRGIHDYSAPGLFNPWTIQHQGGLFILWTIRPLDYSSPGGMEWNKGTNPTKYIKRLTNHTLLALIPKTQILAGLEFGLST